MKDFDWPLAITLVIVFVVLSYARWRWFSARMRRAPKTIRPAPPSAPDDTSTP
ncbi:MAG: hypothetical protein JWL61_4729 [Gemmatimonadetes bacterium]|nr:hypothetical protein [Gemmatimonadota bacterium]